MRAVVLEGFGKEDVMRIGDVPPPAIGPRNLRIRVHAAGVNRADLLQRQGHYPPPAGASEIIGLECAGVVTEIGSEVTAWKIGDRAMALLAGGGYAAEVVVDHGSAMHVPDALRDEEAAAIPEVFLTAFLNLFELARAKKNETVLLHGGGSGVGTVGTTLCNLAGVNVIVTAGTAEKCARCVAHGALFAINYREEDFAVRARELTDGRGVDVILDNIGAKYLNRDLEALAVDGRVVLIGTMGGGRMIELDVSSLLQKRQQVIGSTLRARSAESKAAIVASFLARFGDDLDAGKIRPVIHQVFPLEQAADAHRLMASSEHFGKIVLRVDGS